MATEPRELTGKVINGVVVFENGESLPEGTEVKVEPVGQLPEPKADKDVPEDIKRMREMLLSHAGVIKDSDLPKDLADNLDHYLMERLRDNDSHLRG